MEYQVFAEAIFLGLLEEVKGLALAKVLLLKC